MDKARSQRTSARRALLFLAVSYLFVFAQVVVAGNPDQTDAVSDLGIVLAKLAFYAKQYPDIDFVVLDTAGNVARNMQILAQIIGEDPDPLDYEHPQDLRHQLLMATLVRIELLLQTDVGSATLFAPGKSALAKRKRVCIITMNPWAIAANDRAATYHLLVLKDAELDAITPGHYLDHTSHLQFALDHEVYHCLDSVYNGPMPMSHRERWAGYNMRKDEAGADAFGIIMNIAAHGVVTPYARRLMHIRCLSLLGNDPYHYTFPAINAVLQLDPMSLAKSDVQERFQLASTIRDRTVGNYDDYVRYAIAAAHAIKQLGVSAGEDTSLHAEVDNTMVEGLLDQLRASYLSLIGREMPAAR